MQSTAFRYLDIEQLTTRQLHQIYQIRQEVFVVEQECAYQDCDETDLISTHILGMSGDQFSSYCRVYSKEISVYIGRVLVTKPFRKQGVAKKMMTEVLEYILSQYPTHDYVKLSAQSYLIAFYSDLGFVCVGDPHVEDGIPHQNMELSLEP